MKILLEQQPMVIHRVIVCQRTTYFRSKDLKQVVKLSLPSDLRPPEADLLGRAREHGVAKLLGHRPITSIEELHDGLTLPDSHRFRSASCDASISFSESRSQAILSRSFDAFQSLEISRSRLGKRKSTDKGARNEALCMLMGSRIFWKSSRRH